MAIKTYNTRTQQHTNTDTHTRHNGLFFLFILEREIHSLFGICFFVVSDAAFLLLQHNFVLMRTLAVHGDGREYVKKPYKNTNKENNYKR